MASKVEYKKKTATKRDRSKSKGTARRRKVTVRSSGRNQRHRAILKSRLIDGLTYDELSEMYYMSPRQIKRIVYKSQDVLFRHI